MKKSLIALAVASAVSAPAFAATSNVDIYGVLNLSVNYVDPDVLNQDTSMSVTSTASRIGFKGAEDLGGGLKAIWQIESGFNADEQSGTLANRNSFVGLSGGWGTVLAGNHDTPMKMLGRLVDNFGDTLGDSRNLLGATGDTGLTAFDLRTKNTIAYVSPNWSGLTATLAYVADWNATPAAGIDNNDYDAYSVNAVYTNGPFMLGAAYEDHASAVANSDADMWRIVGGFTIGGFKLGALYEDMSGDNVAYNRDGFGFFGTYTMGAWAFKANYMSVNESDVVGGSDGADQYTLGVDYNLSKRTVVYGYYADVSNDDIGNFGLGAGAGASDQTVGGNGANPSAFGLGVRHAF